MFLLISLGHVGDMELLGHNACAYFMRNCERFPEWLWLFDTFMGRYKHSGFSVSLATFDTEYLILDRLLGVVCCFSPDFLCISLRTSDAHLHLI